MKFKRSSAALSAFGIVAAGAVAVTVSVASAGGATAAPSHQMPFPCGYTATAATFDGHKPANSVDFQKSGITGDPVVASAAGTVSRVDDEGGDSYGKWVEVDHGGGYKTRYAHLSSQAVKSGQSVKLGTKLGDAGATGGVSGPHLHYEQLKDGAAQKVVLDGKAVPYPGHTLFTSKNTCGGGGGNPHTPEEACGAGYSVIDKQALGKAGTAYLLYSSGSGKNCVATMKATSLGKATPASAFIEAKGSKRITDSGNFAYYAGPVSKAAPKTCVKWGGSVGSESYTSPFEHCD